MLDRKLGVAGVLCVVGVVAGGCAQRRPVAVTPPVPAVVATVTPPPVQVEVPVSDPVADLIAVSNRHFDLGQRELQEGHLETAKTQFDRALEVLMESSAGARAETRLREHFDRLVERISAYEMGALVKGDGFTEQRSEPASIDALLSVSTFDEVLPTTETTRTVAEDLQETPPGIDIPLNQRVLSYVELFTGRLKGYLEEGLSRGAYFLPMIQDVLRAEGLPLDLAYVPLIESAFKTNALSSAKAKGMWQFMRGTGLENGLKTDWYIDERSDPEKATVAAAKYLKTLYGMFGDWHLALASYNGGPGRVQRAMKRAKKDDFWTLTASSRNLPRETRDYVPLILAAVIVARNPAQYGLTVEPMDVPVYETVALPSAVDLRRIAEWAGVPVQTIQELNPELRRWTTPVRATDYALKVPAGTADLVRAALIESSIDDLAPLNHHTVKKGETLLSISKKLKVSRADLAEANYLSVKSRLDAGQRLIIPRPPATLDAGSAVPDVVLASNTAAPRTTETSESDDEKVIHRVKRGETLFSIAKRYGTTVASVQTWNRLRGNAIQIGQRLTVFRDRTVATN